MNHSPSGLGAAGLILLLILYFVTRHFAPSLSKLLLLVGGIAVLCVAALVALVLAFAFKKKTPEEQQAAEAASNTAALLQKGRSSLLDLRKLTIRVQNARIRAASEEVCTVVDRILCALKEQPEDIPRGRQLFNYYLPTFGGILRTFLRLEQSGVDCTDTGEKVLVCLKDIRDAMEKLHASLYDDDKLDLSVEMEVLQQLCRQDGLLDERPAGEDREDGGPPINLTL